MVKKEEEERLTARSCIKSLDRSLKKQGTSQLKTWH